MRGGTGVSGPPCSTRSPNVGQISLTLEQISDHPLSPTEYAYFFVYSFVRGSYMKRLLAKAPPGSKAPVISTAMELILGAIAGALAQIFTIPVSVIATRQQLGSLKQDSIPPLVPTSISTKDDQSFLGVAREIIREDGAAGLWAGLRPGLVLTANPAITYGVFERLKNVLLQLRSTTRLTPGMSFLIGSLSKTLATVVSAFYAHFSEHC